MHPTSKDWKAVLKIETSSYETLYAEEAAVARAQGLISWIMEQKGVSQKELAGRLRVSEAAISRLLGHSGGNVTVRRLARVVHALGDKLELTSELRERELAGSWKWENLLCEMAADEGPLLASLRQFACQHAASYQEVERVAKTESTGSAKTVQSLSNEGWAVIHWALPDKRVRARKVA